MCSGSRLVADVVAGTRERPDVPEVAASLTTTIEGEWVIWAYKLARQSGDRFVPLSGRGSYPVDAEAECLAPGPSRRWPAAGVGAAHRPPEPFCTCGFHALSTPSLRFALPGFVCLSVVLSGRVLAFEMGQSSLLFRAQRQTVVRVDGRFPGHVPDGRGWTGALPTRLRRPDDPSGSLARRPHDVPRGAGPERLALPSGFERVALQDDAGWCAVAAPAVRRAAVPDLVDA
jgi:hypothetical protein